MQKKNVPLHICSIRFFLLLCACCLFTGYTHASGEEYENQKITIKTSDEPLDKVLDQIARIANVHFFYNHTQVNVNKKVSLNITDKPLSYVLEVVLGDQNVNLEYQVNRTIVLKPKPQVRESDFIQKVSGLVIDASTKEPLIGASIVLKENKGMGVVTDVDGKFFIEVPKGYTALVITFIGYETENVRLEGKLTDMVVKLSPKTNEMEGVVVTGMTPRKVEGFTGSYVTVKGEDLKKLSPNNLLKALQIFDPSFRIVENNRRGSDPNTLPEFQLRGDVQIGDVGSSQFNMMMGDYSNRPNMPLFILDGFETNLQRIVDLDPERVESITILKDASATAIYGSRAANGVIVFETKKPMPGALNVSYSTNVGITMPDLTDYNLMEAAEKLQFEWDAKLFNAPGMNNETLADKMNYYNHYKQEIQKGVNTYWLSAPLRTAVTHRHSISLDGGDDALRYALNLNYGNTPGVMKESDRKSLGMSLNLQYRRKKWNVNNQLSLNDTKANNTPYGDFGRYTQLNPYYRKTDENGNYIKIIETKHVALGEQSLQMDNPLYNTQFPFKDLQDNFSITNNFSAECAILENLRATASVSFTKSTALTEQFKSMNHTDFGPTEDLTKKGSYAKSIGNSFGWNTSGNINYNLTKDRHLVSMLARIDISETKSDGINLSAKGFPNDNMTDFLFAYEMENRASGDESTSRSIGITGNFSYMYDFRYAVDFSIRGDRSSQFGANTKMKPFWAVGARWNASREKWLEGSVFSNLVVRGSYGITGSQNYTPYQALETYTFDNLMYPYLSSDVLGAELMGHSNPDLGWSTTTNKSVAFEMGILQNRFNFTINYYHNYTDELLLDYTLSPSSGFESMMTNAGSVVNKGYDITLSLMPFQNYEKQIQWNISLNGSHNVNKIEKISNVVKKMNEDNLNRTGAPVPIYEEGKSTTQLFAVQSLGIDPTTGQEVFLKRNGHKTYIWDATDKVALGDSEPKLRGSVSTSFTYKSLSVSLAGTYQFGGYRYNQTLVDKIENSNIGYNLDKRAAENRWRAPGDITPYKSLAILGQTTNTSSRFLQKFNEFAFSSINVGYRFEPKQFKFLERCRIAALSLNATCEEIANLSTVRQERGLDYPFARSFSFSLSLTFN